MSGKPFELTAEHRNYRAAIAHLRECVPLLRPDLDALEERVDALYETILIEVRQFKFADRQKVEQFAMIRDEIAAYGLTFQVLETLQVPLS